MCTSQMHYERHRTGPCNSKSPTYSSLLFFSHSTTPPTHNLLVAGTASEDHALILCNIDELILQMGSCNFPLISSLPWYRSGGVIHALDADVTNENITSILSANGPQHLPARMLGRMTSALLTFKGPHIRIFVKVCCLLIQCACIAELCSWAAFAAKLANVRTFSHTPTKQTA